MNSKAIIKKGKDKGKSGTVVGVYMNGCADIRIDRKVNTYNKTEWTWLS
jgi:hypothetical protein